MNQTLKYCSISTLWSGMFLAIHLYIITNSMRALIGQSAMVYCAGKLMEKSRVF